MPARPTTTCALFPLGRLLITAGASELLDGEETAALIARHRAGDWGDLGEADRKENERALSRRERVLSKYVVKDVSYYVITEADRSVTTLLLCDEY